MGDYKKSKKTVLLPATLVDEVNLLELTKTQKSYALKFLWMLMRDSYWYNKSLFSPVKRPFKHMEANYTKQYNSWLKPLLDNQIVKRTPYSENNCFKYYINNKHYNSLSTWLLCSSSFKNDHKEVTYSDKLTPENKYLKWFREDLNSISINQEELEAEFQKRVTNITVESCGVEVLEKLPPGTYKLYHSTGDKSGYKFSSHDKINNLSITSQKSIIKTSKGVIIEDLKDFLNKKKVSVILYDKNSLNQLFFKEYYAKRNSINNRLDTNLTNLPSVYVNRICEINNLIQIDLVNSQLCFLSKMLNESNNVKEIKQFCELCYTGELYNYVKEKLSLKTREESKQLVFNILFSSNYSKTGKKEFKSLFPQVHNWIMRYKKENGYKTLSTTLQKMESELFMDKIYHRVKGGKLFCLTKHDSLIVRCRDYEKVMKIIHKEFNTFGLKGKLKVSRPDGVLDYFFII